MAEQDWKPADAAESPEVLAKRAPEHSRKEDGTPWSAEVSAILSVCGIVARRRRAERRAKATARRQPLPIFPRARERSGFSLPPPERDLRASESAHALDPARCRHAWIFSAYFAFGCVRGELLRRHPERSTARPQRWRKQLSELQGSTRFAYKKNASREARARSRLESRDQFVALQTDHGGTPLRNVIYQNRGLMGTSIFCPGGAPPALNRVLDRRLLRYDLPSGDCARLRQGGKKP